MPLVNNAPPPAMIQDPWMTQAYFDTPELQAMFEQVARGNPEMVNQLFTRESPAYVGNPEDGPFTSVYEYDKDMIQRMLVEEYQRNEDFYANYDPNAANPNSYWEDPGSGKNLYGIDPGISLDLEQYGLSDQAEADLQTTRDIGNEILNRDYNRFAIDPTQLQQVDAYTYNAQLADVYNTDFENTFDPTRDQLGYANALNDYAANIDGTAIGEAANLQYLAATGQMPSFADRSLQRDANALFAAQNAMAARARGSSGAGLALMNAQNNSALGYAQLLNSADIARAQEMTDARAALAQTGGVIRQGDFQAAQQAAANASQLYAVNNSELGAQQQNTAGMNAGSQYNTNLVNQATQYNAGQMQSADAANAKQLQDTLEGNRQYGMQAQQQDDTLARDYSNVLIAAGENDRAAAITAEQNYQNALMGNADRKANVFTQSQSSTNQLTAQREAAAVAEFGAITGGIGAGVGALATAISDRRAKTLIKPTAEADFTNAEDYEYEYNEHAGPMAGEHRKGPMADDLPEDVVMRGDDGMLRVNIEKLAMRQAAAIGKLQREVASLKGKRA